MTRLLRGERERAPRFRRGLLLVLCVAVGGYCAGAFEFTISKDEKNDLDALPSALLRGAEQAYTINKQGLDALDKGKLDSAMACFSKASAMLPIFSDAENNKAVIHFRRGNVAIAKMIWESIAAKDPEYAVALYNLGVVALYDNDFVGAHDYFQKALKQNKKFVEAMIMMGRALLNMGRKKDACVYFKDALALDRNRPDAWQYYAFGLLSGGDTAAAQAVLVKYKPHPEALKMLGQIEAARGNLAAASTYLSQAISGGVTTQLLVDLAAMQLDARKYKDVLATIRQIEKKSAMTEDAYCIAGIAAKESGDMDAARQMFEKGVKQFPQDPVLRYNLGQMFFLQKKFNQAESTWKSLSDTMQDPSLQYMKALSAKQRGALDEAQQSIELALKIDEKAEYFDLLGVILYARGKKDEAAANFKKALAIDPELRSAQLNLSLLSESKEGLESAAAEMEKRYTGCTSQCREILLQLSILYYHLGKVDKAATLLDGAPDDQKDLKIARHCALYFRQLRDWEKAITVLEKAKKSFVFDAKTDFELAEDYLLAGHYAKAVDAFKGLLVSWEENPWRIFYQLGYASMEQNDLAMAKSYFEKSLKSKPDNVAAQGMLAFVYHLEGNTKQAQTMWEKNLRDDPANPMLHVNLGLSLEKEGKYQEALDHYNKAHALKPAENAIMINIGSVYESMNKNVEALSAYTQALNSPKKDLAAFNIFLLSQKSGNEAMASEMLQTLSREYPSSAYTKRAIAEHCFKQGDTAKGLGVVESIGEKDPVDWFTIARIYAGRGESKKTDQCLAMLPKEPLWEKARAEIEVQRAFASKNFDQAYTLLSGLRDTGFSFQYNLALVALQAKKYQEAVTIGEKLVQNAKGKDRGDVCRVVGNAHFGLKQWNNARHWYEQLAGMQQNDPVVQYNLAVAAYNLADVQASWDYYQKARQLDPALSNKDIENRYASMKTPVKADSAVVDSLDALYNEAVALQRDTNNDTAAEQRYKKILEKKNTYYRAWNNLGAIYSARGNLPDAVNCFTRAIEKQHDIPEAYANLVNVYIAMDSLSMAQRWIVKGLGHNPDSETLKQLEANVKALLAQKKRKKK